MCYVLDVLGDGRVAGVMWQMAHAFADMFGCVWLMCLLECLLICLANVLPGRWDMTLTLLEAMVKGTPPQPE